MKIEPVASIVPCYTPSGKRVALNTRHQGLPIGTVLYTEAQLRQLVEACAVAAWNTGMDLHMKQHDSREVAHTGVRGEVAMTKDVWGDRMTYGPFEETTANARLIVAAPELLEAAIELKDVCNRPSAARTRAEAWRKLDKAIAKALQPNAGDKPPQVGLD